MIIPAYLGEVTHHLKSGTKRFTPEGEIFIVTATGHRVSAKERNKNPLKREGSGGLAARLFVGLKVGDEVRWTIDDVIKLTYKTLSKERRAPDASILAQSGIYKDFSGKPIIEPSVQIIVIDFQSTPKEKFVKQMGTLGERLAIDLEQEKVILEIQNHGISEDVYTVTQPEKKPKKRK